MNTRFGLLLATTSARLYNYMPFLIDIGDTLSGIVDKIVGAIYTAVGFIMYLITIAVLGISRIIFQIYYILVGIKKVRYDNESEYLINIFFENSAVDYVYRGMLVIGFVLCIAFTIAAVIRKTFDISDKNQTSLGGIILNAGKAILIMLIMTFVVTTTVNLSNVLIQRVSLLFDDAYSDTESRTVKFSNEDLAAMGRIYSTIGNYSVNPTYDSRYNINSCFNEIRSELQALKDKKLFDVHYVTYDADGNEIDTWQSVLEKIIMSAPLNQNLTIDIYNESATKAIVYAMDILKSNKSFLPLSEYHQSSSQKNLNQEMNLDVVLFLMGTGDAALNTDFNDNPSIHDKARSPFYEGEKSIYFIGDVSDVFDISLGKLDYIMIQIATLAVLWQILQIILNCVQRIFSMLVLYLAAPPIISSMPFDEGAKFKQWVSAFVVQAFGIVGQVICMRVLMLFIQICFDNKLILSENGEGNFLAQSVLVVCACFACRKASDILNGILAGNGGMSSAAATSALGTGMANFTSGMMMSKIMGPKGGAGAKNEDGADKKKDPKVLETDGDDKLPGKLGLNLGGSGDSGNKGPGGGLNGGDDSDSRSKGNELPGNNLGANKGGQDNSKGKNNTGNKFSENSSKGNGNSANKSDNQSIPGKSSINSGNKSNGDLGSGSSVNSQNKGLAEKRNSNGKNNQDNRLQGKAGGVSGRKNSLSGNRNGSVLDKNSNSKTDSNMPPKSSVNTEGSNNQSSGSEAGNNGNDGNPDNSDNDLSGIGNLNGSNINGNADNENIDDSGLNLMGDAGSEVGIPERSDVIEDNNFDDALPENENNNPFNNDLDDADDFNEIGGEGLPDSQKESIISGPADDGEGQPDNNNYDNNIDEGAYNDSMDYSSKSFNAKADMADGYSGNGYVSQPEEPGAANINDSSGSEYTTSNTVAKAPPKIERNRSNSVPTETIDSGNTERSNSFSYSGDGGMLNIGSRGEEISSGSHTEGAYSGSRGEEISSGSRQEVWNNNSNINHTERNLKAPKIPQKNTGNKNRNKKDNK